MVTRLRADSFEGHDVLIVLGTLPGQDLRFRQECLRLQNRILKDDVSLIFLVYDGATETGKAEAEGLLSALRMLLKSSPLDRLIKTVEYGDLCARFPKDRNFSLSVYRLDKSMAVPDVCHEEAASSFLKVDPKFFDTYADIPETRDELLQAASVLANSSTTSSSCVLLTGPSGCGKTFTAKIIFDALKDRKLLEGQFVHVNCATLPKDRIDTFLFGVPKGTFTDVKEREGAIGNAENGVLFLDEIGNLPYEAQSNLLTFLDKGMYYSGGEYGEQKRSNCKLVFGTNANLPQEILEGRFRYDLYARIKTLSIELPTLASRIARNADEFLPRLLEDACRNNGGLKPTANAIRRFNEFALGFSWPANFRDVNGLFTLLKNRVSMSNANGIVSASVMRDVVEQYKCDNDLLPMADGVEPESEVVPVESEDVPDGVAAYEVQLLPFVRKIARESDSRNQAGIKFFRGRELSNYSDAFGKFLAKFGLAWDRLEDGHLKKVAGELAKEGHGS